MNRAGVFTSNGRIPPNRTLCRDSFDESSFSGDRGSFSDNTYETVGNNTPSMSSGNGSSLGGRNPQETEHLFPPEDSVTASRDVDNLKTINRRLEIVFHLVTGLCVVVIVLYVIAIACFVIKMQQQHQLRSPSSSGSRSNGDELPNCVDKDELTAFKKIWDPEDRRHVTGGDELSYTFRDNKFCFHDLRWLPLFMGKMNAAVNESVKFIEDQQTKINDTVNKYLVNSTEKADVATEQEVQNAVFAHFVLDDSAVQTGGHDHVPWRREGVRSTKRGIDVNPRRGKFTVRHAGFYFLYTQVTFKDGINEPTDVQVVRTRKSNVESILQGSLKPASLQGVFLLHEKDELVVKAPRLLVNSGSPLSTYFGLYLIRA